MLWGLLCLFVWIYVCLIPYMHTSCSRYMVYVAPVAGYYDGVCGGLCIMRVYVQLGGGDRGRESHGIAMYVNTVAHG